LGNTAYINYYMFTHISGSVHGLRPLACNFNCLFETEGLLKVTGSHVHCKSSNISETVQDRKVVTTNH